MPAGGAGAFLTLIEQRGGGVKHSIKAFIKRDGVGGYFAECLEVDVEARGETLDETVCKLRREICSYLRGRNMAEFGLVDEPTLFMTFEDEPIIPSPLQCSMELEGNA